MLDMVIHVLSVPWNVICAMAPPPTYGGGWATFIYGARIVISFQTAINVDVAEVVGCSLGIPAMVPASFLVDLGPSIPDTFGS